MYLSPVEEAMLSGEHGPATRKAMQILETLGRIYGAERMAPVESVQIAGVSYDNLGEAGLAFLTEMAAGGGKARVLTTLNPAGMDIENAEALGIDADFATNQRRVIEAFGRMNVVSTCTCTPYLVGNLPRYGAHIAWAESSAVAYANSVIGARTNREGGPSALAAALTGRTPLYGYHLDERRRPTVAVRVEARVAGTQAFGALGRAVGERLAASGQVHVPYLSGIEGASLEELKSLCASIATYGGTALFHIPEVTPEAARFEPPEEGFTIGAQDLQNARQALQDGDLSEVDFVSLGCPHLSIAEVARLAELLDGKQVVKEFWITTARPTKQIADRMGYTAVIEATGAKFAADTCCVVAPIRGRFQTMATDSAKACYYASAKNKFQTAFLPFEQVVAVALGEEEISEQ
jgi:hypothetical protein